MPATPVAPPRNALQPSRTLTREDLIRLGQTAGPWSFLPIAVQALAQLEASGRSDPGIELLAASSFARLGLHTPARELLSKLPAEVKAASDVARLDAALSRAGEDVIDPAARVETCRRNLEALRARGADLGAAFEPWRTSVLSGSGQWLRCADGNIARRERTPGGWRWTRLRDEAGEARRVEFPHKPGAGAHEPAAPRPHIVEGIDPPWLLLRLMELTPRGPDGYTPSVCVVQADEHEFLDGLSAQDLSAVFAQDRVRVFVGARGVDAWRVRLHTRLEWGINGPVISNTTVRTRVTPSVQDTLRSALQAQQDEAEARRARLTALYAQRTAAWWADRYERAFSGRPGERPLRVLVPTCRYSTYVQHASRDLADQLRAIGCEARVVIEPDDSTKPTAVMYLRSIEEFEPDLIVLINYTREQLKGSIPDGVPFVTWVQDAMPHLFDARLGGAQGPLDFLVGNVFPALHDQFGYPRGRTRTSPVASSDRTFHPAPAPSQLRDRYACEVAYISHHSETPEALLARTIDGFAGQAGARAALEALFPRLRDFTRDLMAGPIHLGVERLTREVFAEASGGREIDDALFTLLLKQCAMPLADRLVRHQTLEWAAEVCERRNWRLRIHGRGWEKSERFGPYARPEVPHGEDLRAAYQAASCHLHMTINALPHQRVFECALSGGLPLCRMHHDELAAAIACAEREAFETGAASYSLLSSRAEAYRVADHPSLMVSARLQQRFGRAPAVAAWKTPDRLENMRRWSRPKEQLLATLAGDPGEVTFASKDDLEACVDRALTRPAWRENCSRMIAKRVRSGVGLERFARDVLDLVRTSLAGGNAQ